MVLFESSGMYKGEDVILLVAQLMAGQLDAVWGSRRLSLADIRHAYRLLHHNAPVRGAVSYIGSHVLSLACLFLYGRYVNDTLSGVRAIRTSILRQSRLDPKHSNANFQMLSVLLRLQAEVIETPVRYFPISPQKVKRTSVGEGVTALWTLVRRRFTRCRPAGGAGRRDRSSGGKASPDQRRNSGNRRWRGEIPRSSIWTACWWTVPACSCARVSAICGSAVACEGRSISAIAGRPTRGSGRGSDAGACAFGGDAGRVGELQAAARARVSAAEPVIFGDVLPA